MTGLLSAEEGQARDGRRPPLALLKVGLLLKVLLLSVLALLIFVVIPPLSVSALSADRRRRFAARGQEKFTVHSACLGGGREGVRGRAFMAFIGPRCAAHGCLDSRVHAHGIPSRPALLPVDRQGDGRGRGRADKVGYIDVAQGERPSTSTQKNPPL